MTGNPFAGETGFGLGPRQFAELFPFHVILDENLTVVQFGRSLARLVPTIRPGIRIAEVFLPHRPAHEWTLDDLRNGQSILYVVRCVGSHWLLRGQVQRIRESPDHFALLGSPWIQDAESLHKQGLTVTDFAIHDVSMDLIQVVESKRIANADLRDLNERLVRQQAELQRVNAEILARNAELERTARALEEAQRVARLGVWRYSSEEDRVEWSAELSRIVGIDRMAFGTRLRDWLALIHPADRSAVELAFTARIPGEMDLDFRIVRPDGRRRYVHLTGGADGTVGRSGDTVGTLQDVTDRRRSERLMTAQRRQIRKLALVAARTENGVVITDAAGRIEWANVAFRRQTGYRLADLRGRTPGSLLQVEETDPAVVAQMRACLARGEGYNVELVNASADGRRYWVALDVQAVRDRRGRIAGYVSIQRDVTASRQQQLALERLRAERDTILELSPDGFLAFDPAGRSVYANPAVAEFLKIDPTSIAALRVADFDRIIAGRMENPGSYPPIATAPDGAVETLRFGAGLSLRRTIKDEHGPTGSRRGRIVYLRNVTGEMELERLRGEFLATAAHEMRTPMSNIYGFSELLMRPDLEPTIQREVVETIHHQADFIVRMVNDLLDLERLSVGRGTRDLRIVEFPLAPHVQKVIDGLLIDGDPRRARLLLDDWSNPSVVADADKLQQALLNVLANAYRYSGATSGDVEVAIRERGDALCRQVGIAVRDRGIGMTPEQVKRIFDRFYRVNAHDGAAGTGLGMTIVKEIVERMGGEVTVDSAIGEGTTVTLWLLRGGM